MPRTMKHLAVLALVVVLAAAAFGTAYAGSTQTGTIRGKVMDSKSQPLPGATLVFKSPSMIRERAVQTDAEGNFFVPGLPPGDYSVTTQMDGYTTTETKTIVELDKVTPLNITMMSGELTETVTVTSTRPVVAKTQTEKAVVVNKKFADTVPVGRNYLNLLQFAPGVTGGTNPNMMGGTANSNIYLIDGVSTTDPVTGTFGANFTFDAIETMDIKLTGVSAEYGQFQGGVSNLITKSGGNSFTGSVKDVISQGSWTREFSQSSTEMFVTPPTHPTHSPADEKRTHNAAVGVGGPIVTDNVWFFLSYNKTGRTTSALLGWSRGGFYGNGTFDSSSDGDNSLGKVTWQANNNHRLVFNYSEDPLNIPVCYVGTCMDTPTYTLQGQGGKFWALDWNAIWGSKLVTDFKYAQFQNGFTQSAVAPIIARPGLPVGPIGLPVMAYSPEFGYHWDAPYFSFDPEVRSRKQYEGQGTMFIETKNLGTHQLKVGLDYQEQEKQNKDQVYGNGYYYMEFVPERDPVTTNADPYDINNRIYSLYYQYDTAVNAGNNNKSTAAYIQDDWQLNQHFAFNIGLRWEKSANENNVGEKIIDTSGFAPRLGMAWDIGGNGKHIAKATLARYLQGINLTTLNQFVRSSGGRSSYTVCENRNKDEEGNYLPGTPDYATDPTDPSCFRAGSGSNSAASQYAEGIKPQRIDEWTLGYEWALSPELGVGVKYVDRTWGDITTVKYHWMIDENTGGAFRSQRIDNNPDAKRSYRAIILTAEKRFSDNWQLLASYTYSKAEGNVTTEAGFDSYGSYEDSPTTQATTLNRYGYLPWDQRNNVKLQGLYRLPLKSEKHSVTLGANFNFNSGVVYEKSRTVNRLVDPELGRADQVTEYYEARGSRTSPDIKRLDGSVNYAFALSKKLSFDAKFEIFNMTDEHQALGVSGTWRNNEAPTSPTNKLFGFPTSYTQLQTPRRYQFIVGLSW